jgi:hypothetical protein
MSIFHSIYNKIHAFLLKYLVWVVLFLFLIRFQPVWQIIRKPFTELWSFIHIGSGYDSQAIGVIVSSILAIGTIYLAWIANQTAQNAKEISKLALESERPILKLTSAKDESKPDSTDIVLKIENVGKSDACLQKIRFITIKTTIEREYSTNISYGVDPLDIIFENTEETIAVVVKYKNMLTNKTYIQSGEIREGNLGKVYQAGTSYSSPISTSDNSWMLI